MTPSKIVVFVAGAYRDVSSAKRDYRATKDYHYETNEMGSFDAAVLGRQDTGKMKIFRKYEEPTLHGELTGPGWGLATGLAIALFPSAAVGTNLLVGAPGAHGGISTFAGHVASGLGRENLLALGLLFDSADAGLISATTEEMLPTALTAMQATDTTRISVADIDMEDLESDIRGAYVEAIR